jgi:hypothetical protein
MATATRDELATRIDAKINGLGARLATCLAAANGRRRERTLTLVDALANVRSVANGHDWDFSHGGGVANAYSQSAITTFVLAARVGGKAYLGFAVANAKGSIGPGRAWKSLQPWRDGVGPRGDEAAKWTAWSAEPNVLTLEDPMVDAILESLAD